MGGRYVITEGAREAVFHVGDDFWADREACEVTGSDVRVRVRRVGGSASGGAGSREGCGRVELEVGVEGTATMPCDRCLDDCTLPVAFAETVEMDAPGGEADLEQYIYESVILGLPFSKVHQRREDCNPEMTNIIKN